MAIYFLFKSKRKGVNEIFKYNIRQQKINSEKIGL